MVEVPAQAPSRIQYINSSNASALGKRSAEVRAARKLARSSTVSIDPYVAERLARVRKQIARLDDMLDASEDHRELDSITRAIDRLAKLECYLANRPGPGNYKPTAPRQSRDRAPIAPVDAPAPPAPPAPQPNQPESTP